MDRTSDSSPATLAQLIGRRGRPVRTQRNGLPSGEPTADALGQFGLLFTPPEAAVVEEVTAEEVPVALLQDLERKLWSVAALVGVLRGRLERDYGDVWVEGEISNAKLAASGAFYFTLKDGEAQLPAVLFRRQAALLKWKPADGMAVLARGRISVFEPRGQLQLIAESLESRGAGALQLEFEQRKARLRSEGLFDPERKRPLPAYPATIGVVTSTQGAVIRDIVTVCRRRHGCMNILVYPAAVQGAGAAAELAAGVRYFNSTAAHEVDVIVVARGGGSTEDLWAFNDETLARTIASSAIPTVSAVGHETDFTIADFVADLRAPTPSAAAELITEAQHRAEERVDALRARLLRGVRWQAMSARQRFTRISATAVLRRVPEAVERRVQRLDTLETKLFRAMENVHTERGSRLGRLRDRMRRQDPGSRIAASSALLGAMVARLDRTGRGIAQTQRTRLERTSASLRRLSSGLTVMPRSQVDRAGIRLQALSPMAVLERGYALAFAADGKLLRSVRQTAPGAAFTLRLADGTVHAATEETTTLNAPARATQATSGGRNVPEKQSA